MRSTTTTATGIFLKQTPFAGGVRRRDTAEHHMDYYVSTTEAVVEQAMMEWCL